MTAARLSGTRPAASLPDVRAPVLLLLLALSACRGGEPPRPAPDAQPVATEAVASPPPSAPPSPPALDAPNPCAQVVTLDGPTLHATWPQRLGQRVRLRARVERALDLTTALVTAGGRSFVVLVGPDRLWQGERLQVFSVMGSTVAPLGGKVALPQLLLDTDPCLPP